VVCFNPPQPCLGEAIPFDDLEVKSHTFVKDDIRNWNIEIRNKDVKP
jgi:hypothetical protein